MISSLVNAFIFYSMVMPCFMVFVFLTWMMAGRIHMVCMQSQLIRKRCVNFTSCNLVVLLLECDLGWEFSFFFFFSLQLPDYHDVIDNPMDFATVRKKLANGSYTTLEKFEVC
jgi:hypothetical protein